MEVDFMLGVCVFLGIVIINSFVLTIYCRYMPYLEKRNKPCKSFLERKIHSLLIHYMYGWMRYCLLITGHIPSNRVRNIIYRIVFNAHISSQTVINGGCEIRSPWNLYCGNCVIMNNCIIDARSVVRIADNVVFGQGVHIWTEEHDVNSATFEVTEKNRGPVIIDKHAWICSDSTILPGVYVGEGAVLATRACATKDLEAFGIYIGIPARKHGTRNDKLTYTLSGKPHWHFY